MLDHKRTRFLEYQISIKITIDFYDPSIKMAPKDR